jgi:hypothetical protein
MRCRLQHLRQRQGQGLYRLLCAQGPGRPQPGTAPTWASRMSLTWTAIMRRLLLRSGSSRHLLSKANCQLRARKAAPVAEKFSQARRHTYTKGHAEFTMRPLPAGRAVEPAGVGCWIPQIAQVQTYLGGTHKTGAGVVHNGNRKLSG